jgi:hypothetical protein
MYNRTVWKNGGQPLRRADGYRAKSARPRRSPPFPLAVKEDHVTCECGSGETPVRGSFIPGHDQRLRSSLEQRVGGFLQLRTLADWALAFRRYSSLTSGALVVRGGD